MQLPVTDVERDHAPRATLEQDVGEAAGGRADVDRVDPGDVESERVERVRELVPGARDVGRRTLDRQLGRLVDLSARLVVARHEPDEHERLRLRAALDEAALHQQYVQSFLHAAAGANSSSGARIARTLGCPTVTARQSAMIALAPKRVVEMPIAAETGPASADPSGIRTNEPSASYELTRDRASSGTCCWKTVNHNARWTASPTPVANEIAARAGTGSFNASPSGCSTTGDAAAQETKSGRRGRMRSASTPPTTAPAPNEVSSVAHAAAPPRSRFAITGPR